MSKKFKKRVLSFIAPPILYLVVYFIYLTCKKRYHFDEKKVVESSCVFAFWHGELLMLPFAYRDYRKSKNIDSMISEHSDGEIASRFIKLVGGGVIRGSSTRGGIKALKAAFKSIKEGRDVGLTPDGPKGPRHSVSDGVVLISQKKDIPIVTMNCNASNCWRFKSWDRFFIPKPFSRLDFYFSEPFSIKGLDMSEAKTKIKERLMRHAF